MTEGLRSSNNSLYCSIFALLLVVFLLLTVNPALALIFPFASYMHNRQTGQQQLVLLLLIILYFFLLLLLCFFFSLKSPVPTLKLFFPVALCRHGRGAGQQHGVPGGAVAPAGPAAPVLPGPLPRRAPERLRPRGGPEPRVRPPPAACAQAAAGAGYPKHGSPLHHPAHHVCL